MGGYFLHLQTRSEHNEWFDTYNGVLGNRYFGSTLALAGAAVGQVLISVD